MHKLKLQILCCGLLVFASNNLSEAGDQIPNGFPVDLSFNPPAGELSVLSTALQPDGKLLVASWFTSSDGISPDGLIRLNSDGALDTDFHPDTGIPRHYAYASLVAVQPDRKILVAGRWGDEILGGQVLVRLNANGSRDPTFTAVVPEGVRSAF